MKRKLLISILLLIIIGNFLYRIWGYRENYLIPYNNQFWHEKYIKSQWVVSNSKEGIGDDGLFTYVGYQYVNGLDPTGINAETPPLGKYLIGITILIFNNQAVFAILTGISSIILLFFLAKSVLGSVIPALCTVLLFSFDQLFYTQLSAPYLDLLYLTTILAFLLFLQKKHYFYAAVSFGLMMGTKNSLSSLLTGVCLSIVFTWLQGNKDFKKWILNLPFAGIVFLLIYIQYFLLGHTIKDFLGVQKWIALFYAQGAKSEIGSYLLMLLKGEWHTWWGTVQRVTEWNILWPISAGVTLIWGVNLVVKKNLDSLVILIWCLIYSVFLLFIPVWPRYFLLQIPFFYLITIHLLNSTIHSGYFYRLSFLKKSKE